MSEANGTGTNGTVNRIEGATKKPAKSKGGDFYARMNKLCSKKQLTLKAENEQGTYTMSIKTFPTLSKSGVTEAAAGGAKFTFKPTDRIDGKQVTATGQAEGEDGSTLAGEFLDIPTDEQK
jgi:hypothetical protein